MRDSLSISPNIRTTSSLGRKILQPSCTRRCIYLQTHYVIYGEHTNAWGLLVMALYRACLDQGVPMWIGITSST